MKGRVIIAAPASGSGKTVITLGLIRHLANGGHEVVAAKLGPDYIDAAYHTAASGAPCHNLDLWAMRAATLAAEIDPLQFGDDITVCEGAMGLFDGVGACGEDASTAALAALTGWPVILVVDARGQGASVAALVAGFARHRTDVPIRGVILNRVGSERHQLVLREALARHVADIPVLGAVPRSAVLELPERHLGLVQAREHRDLDQFLDSAAAVIAEHVDVDAALRIAAAAEPRDIATPPWEPPIRPLGKNIAVAYDDAFAFNYPATMTGWRFTGALVWPFSPLADQPPREDADAVFLPGGYPELHADRLASNHSFLRGLRAAAERGAVIFGECGGYMVLGESLTDADGVEHRMAGLLPLRTSFAERRLHLGYRRARLLHEGPLGPAGTIYRGHEFHYSSIVAEGAADPLFAAEDALGNALGPAGLQRGRVCGSFIHLIDRELG